MAVVGPALVGRSAIAAVIRVQTVGRLSDDRGGEYGQASEPPRRWRLVVCGIGVVLVAVGR